MVKEILDHKNLTRPPGHLLRRLLHLSCGLIPLIYYWSPFKMEYWVICMMLIVAILEAVRLVRGQVLYGQRSYETKRISSFAWTMFAIGLVLMLAPKIGVHGAGIGVPLIWSLAVGDPLVGEARIMRIAPYGVWIIGVLAVAAIWALSAYALATPWWLLLIITPITVLSERYHPSWMDDNAAMLLFPLLCVLWLV